MTYEEALQEYKVANKKRDDLKKQLVDAESEREEAFYEYKEEAKKVGKW